MATIEDLIQKIKFYSPGADTDLIRLAYDYAKKAHEGQKRLNGEPYINHCLATAINLAEMKLSQNIIIAGLLHDVPEETKPDHPEIALKEIKHNFGEEVATLVYGITKLEKIRLKLLKAVAGFSVEQNNAGEFKTKNAERIKIYSIHGRTKRLWSIFNKLKTKNARRG